MAAPADVSDSLATRLDALLGSRASRPSASALFKEAARLDQTVIAHDWATLAEQSSRCLGGGYATLRRLQGEAERASRLAAGQRPIAETFARLLRIVAESDRRDAFAQTLSETLARSDPQTRLEALLANRPPSRPPLSPELLARLRAAVTTRPEERIDIADSLDKLARGKTRNVSLLAPYSPRTGEALAADIDRIAPYALLCLCRGLLAGVHAEFNLALGALSHRPPSMIDAFTTEAMHDVMARLMDDAEGQLRRRQRALYGALVAGRPADEVAESALAMAGDIERHLPGFVRVQAAIRLAMLRLRDQGKGTAAERHGRLGVRAGALTREALASHCAGYRLALAVLGPHPERGVATLLKKAEALPFATALPNGKDTPLHKLDASREGAFVEVEGLVTGVEAERQADGKLIGHLALRDPSSGAGADAVAVFAHLPHAGITRDAYCRLTGVFTMTSALFQGRPAVEVDALSLAELAKASWSIAFLRLAEPWFRPWHNQANLAWSLGPHGDDAGLFGAGELLFTPLIRR